MKYYSFRIPRQEYLIIKIILIVPLISSQMPVKYIAHILYVLIIFHTPFVFIKTKYIQVLLCTFYNPRKSILHTAIA